jgi:hypothetical protein
VDRRAGDVATESLEVLTDGGFNTSPGIVGASEIEPPKGGPMILYRQGEDAMAEVVGSYFGGMELIPAPEHVLPPGVDVAVVVTGGYAFPEPQEGEPVECPV